MQQTNNIHNIKLNWAGLGRTQPQRCWADFGPKMDWANLGPTETNIPFWARPGPEGRAGPGSAWPSNQNGWGELFSPHPCMQNAIRSACREEKNKYKNERVEELPGAGVAVACCVSGGAVAEAGGGVWAHGRRLQAAAAALCFLVFSRDSPPGLFSSNFQLFLPLPMFRSSFFFPSLSSLGLFFFLFSVFLFSLLSVSLFFGSLSPFLLFFGFSPPSVLFFFFLICVVLAVIYRAK